MKDEPEMVIPLDRLPPGFAERVEAPADVAEPKPAATAVLVRDADEPEILLLRRLRSSGFVPGAWVFPGGRVDEEDAEAELTRMLGLVPRGAEAPYWLAAVREVFEETGVLLARARDADAGQTSESGRPSSTGEQLRVWRERLLSGGATLRMLLEKLGLVPDISRMVYCSHWITPVAEPRRYDTRFFLAELPAGAEVRIDEREMSDAVWLSARAALDRFRRGTLPMVFPTVKTLQLLAPYRSVEDMLSAFRQSEVPAVLPRLVRTRDGVGIVMPDE